MSGEYVLFLENGLSVHTLCNGANLREDMERILGGNLKRCHFGENNDKIGFFIEQPTKGQCYYNMNADEQLGVAVAGPFLVRRIFLFGK